MSDLPQLLTRLRERDLTTYQRILEGIPIKPASHALVRTTKGIWAERYEGGNIPAPELMPEVLEAWIQYVIQEAIKSRATDYSVGACPPGMFCEAHVNLDGIHVRSARGKTEVEAYLKAYLAALEVP